LGPLPWTPPAPSDDCPKAPLLCDEQGSAMSLSPPLINTSTTESQTQTMHKILALLEELQELMLLLLQLVSSHALFSTTCNTDNPLTHLTQPNPTQRLHQTPLTNPVQTQPKIMHKLEKGAPFPNTTTHNSTSAQIPLWSSTTPYLHSVQALLTSQAKHVRFKTHASCRCTKVWPWPKDTRPPSPQCHNPDSHCALRKCENLLRTPFDPSPTSR